MSDARDALRGASPPIQQRTRDVYISHAREDVEIAHAIANAMEDQGFSAWLDTKLEVGESLKTVEQALRSSGAVIVLLSADSLSSPWVRREIDVALETLPRRAVFPVAVGDVDVRTAPSWLATRKWLHLRDSRRVDGLVERLLPALDAVLGSKSDDEGSAKIIGTLPPRIPLVGVDEYLFRLCAQSSGMTWIVGFPGTGKTMLAREYAFKVRNEVDFICWMSGTSEAANRRQLRLAEEEAALGRRGLVVFDDFDSPGSQTDTLRRLRALGVWQRVVITARRVSPKAAEASEAPDVLTIGPLSYEDTADYLARFAPDIISQDRDNLTRVIQSAGGSPWALRMVTQALRTRPVDSVLGAASNPGTTIREAIKVSLQGLSSAEEHRLYVLSFCTAFLDIVRSIEVWRLPGDDDLFRRLVELGLCSTGPNGQVVFHRLVVDYLRSEAPRQAIEDAVAYLVLRLPDPNQPDAETFLSSVADLTSLTEFVWGRDTAANLTELIIWQAMVWRAAGEFDRADMLCPRALAMAHESGQTLLQIRALNLQSALAFDRGRIDEASAIERTTSTLAVEELGPEHPIAIASLANLATSHRARGDLPEAITLLRRVVHLAEQTLPLQHPDLAVTRTNLAVCLRDAGLADEAFILLSKAAHDIKDQLMLLQVEQIRAAVLSDKGQRREAIEVLTEALDKADLVGLAESPDFLTARSNLAMLYARQGSLSDALTLQESVTDQLTLTYGPGHPVAISARSNYAGLLAEAGRVPEALRLFTEIAHERERVLGSDHPDTLQSLLRLARIVSVQGDSSRAVELYSDLLGRATRVLGPEHPTSFSIREEFARQLGDTGDPVGARLTLTELQADLVRVLSREHPMTRRVAATLAEGTPEARIQ